MSEHDDDPAALRSDATRRLVAVARICRHGMIAGGIAPWSIATEQLEAYADELDWRELA